MKRKHDSILGTVGNTPVVKLHRLAPDGIDLYVKVEAFNPLGSVKDRLALGIIEDAERRGLLRPGQTVVEATSGNTGIGLAMVCAAKGYPLVVVMAESFSVERRKILRFLGAKVVLTPAGQRGTGMIAKARELAERHGWFLCRQFENEANADVHSATTAREILADFDGERLDWWVTGFGTGGTLKGVARVLKAERPDTRVAVCEPDNSALLTSGIPQERNDDGTPAAGHPAFRPHVVQGWVPDFVPKLTGDAVGADLIDRVVPVDGAEAVRLSRELACKEGIFTGISGGATLAGALALCETLPRGSSVLCMLPDTGERYLSTPLFEGIAEVMTDEEMDISRSTPNHRFDVAGCPLPPAPAPATDPPPAAAAEAEAFLDRAIADRDRPVTMFAMEWCEFCWTLRSLFDRCGIPFRSYELDSAEFREGDLGGRIRGALFARTGSATIPQVFVGGVHVGGCTETLDALRDGRLEEFLRQAGAESRIPAGLDPYTLLPSWLHPR